MKKLLLITAIALTGCLTGAETSDSESCKRVYEDIHTLRDLSGEAVADFPTTYECWAYVNERKDILNKGEFRCERSRVLACVEGE